jgi:uncharacterized secreted protein with C-terminal beta-propeller domain
MGDFLETYKKLHPKETRRWYDYPIMMYTNWAKSLDFDMVEEVAMNDEAVVYKSDSATQSADMWGITDYSTTNIQKVWIDEPEILKSNWKYLFYYSEASYNDRYISIIKTPTQNDLSDAEVIAKINIPESLNNIQLFLNGNKLIILGSRYASKYDSILW